MEPEDVSESKANKTFGRREFFKKLGKATIAAVGASFLRNLPVQARDIEGVDLKKVEHLREIPINVLMFDFMPEEPMQEINQEEFPSNDQLMQRLLQGNYIPKDQIQDHYGDWDNFYQQNPQAALAYSFLSRYQDHGQWVAESMAKGWRISQNKSTPVGVPLQELLDQTKLSFPTDEWGNKGMSLSIDPELIIDQIDKAKNTHPGLRVVNFSFQIGDVEYYKSDKERDLDQPYLNTQEINGKTVYFVIPSGDITQKGQARTNKDGVITYVTLDGKEYLSLEKQQAEEYLDYLGRQYKKKVKKEHRNPGTRIVGAYDKEKASKNLAKLIKVAQANPELLIVAAGGNEGEDLRVARESLAWPSNLLTVAQWNKNQPRDDTYGVDIYVDNRLLGLPEGSSHSTPFISAYASTLFSQGLALEEVKSRILGACDLKSFIDLDGKQNQGLIFNVKKIVR